MNQIINVSGGICANYMAGFCPWGPTCKQKHIKSVVIDEDTSLKLLANFPDSENWPRPSDLQEKIETNPYNRRDMKPKQPIICHHCGEHGHKQTYCQEEKIDKDELKKIL